MSKIKLSIVIPVWNQEELVKRAIESIPIREDVELIVVNDGSTDNTSQSVEEALRKRNLKTDIFVDCVSNEGVASALNTGLSYISGEYYVALGSDDYFLTDELNKFIDTQLDGTDMVYFNLRINDGGKFILNEKTCTMYVGSTKAYRCEFIKGIRYPDKKKALEDLSFDTRVRSLNPTMKFTDMTIKHYNWPRKNSLTYLVANKKIDSKDLGKPYSKNKKKQITKATKK